MSVDRRSVLSDLRRVPGLFGTSAASIINSSVFKILPRMLKYLLFVILLANARSLPFVWHFLVFRQVFVFQLRHAMFRLRILFKPRSTKEKMSQKWWESLEPMGVNPFDAVTTYRTWASIDDSDFNGHLSNSSYAKTNDSARFEFVLHYFPSFFRVGGRMALGATHYHFLREIPMFRKYEVRHRIVGWDNKWIFIIGRFVTSPQSKKSHHAAPAKNGKEIPPSTSLQIPTNGLGTPATPDDAAFMSRGTSSSDVDAATETMRAITATQLNISEEPDGATLHCISVSQVCFKHGRITFPPGILLAASGFSAPPSSESTTGGYSHSNPPPQYPHIQSLNPWRSPQKYREFVRGGWRDVPETERWWVDALGGVVEEQRRVNVEGLVGNLEANGPMGLLRRGMDGARTV